MPRPTISLNVVTFNESARIGRCLSHVADHVDEIVVVDQKSTDGTPDMAHALGALVVPDDNHLFADPSRPLAESRSSCDWILAVDADEEFTADFLAVMPNLLRAAVAGFDLERENYFGGQHWSADWHLRLWRRGQVAWPRFDRPHRRWSVPTSRPIAGAMVHAKSWSEQLADDVHYERLGSGVGPFLALARARGVSGAELDDLSVDAAKALGFDCVAVREGRVAA